MSLTNSCYLSIIVPVRNEAKHIMRILQQLCDQDYPHDKYEILVIDGQSTDGTLELTKEFSKYHPFINLRILRNERKICSAAHNLGISAGNGDYYLIVDAHVFIPNTHLLSDLVRTVSRTNALILGRPQPLNPPNISYFQRAVAVSRSCQLGHSQQSFIYSEREGWVSPLSVGAMYHRSVFELIGDYDESFECAEDLELNYRAQNAGLGCYISPKFMIQYYPRDTVAALFTQMFRYGRGRIHCARKHSAPITLDLAVPAVAAMLLFTLLILGFMHPAFWAICIGLVLIYFLIVIIAACRMFKQHPVTCVLALPAILPIIHLGVGIGILYGLFVPRYFYKDKYCGAKKKSTAHAQ